MSGPWLVRMAVGARAERAMTPLRAESHEDLEKIRSPFAASSPMGAAGFEPATSRV
jgi:hypothetical protein